MATQYEIDVIRMNLGQLENPDVSWWSKLQVWHRCWKPGCRRWKLKRDNIYCPKHRKIKNQDSL